MPLPLEGYKVTDIGQVWAGPILAHLLGDMGAEVIRIESEASTDHMRTIAADPSEIRKRMQSQFLFRNRQCVTLNFTKPRGVELAKEIIKRTDIVLENYTPRVLKKFGLEYSSLRKVKPDIIMVSMSAAGHSGPYQDMLGYGPSINAISGVDSLVGYHGDANRMVNVWDADPTTAVTASFAVLTALHYRERTGKGQHIDLAFYEALATLSGEGIMDYTMNGRVPEPQGNRHPTMVPHGIYPCRGTDRWVSIAVKGQDEWERFCQAIGAPPWTRDDRFVDVFSRLQHRDELDEQVGLWTREQDSYEAMHTLQAHGVAAAIVASLEDVYLDPHEQHRRTSAAFRDPNVDRSEVVYGIPWHLSDTPGEVRELTHEVGQDNERIFCGMLGMPKDEMRRLMDEHVIY